MPLADIAQQLYGGVYALAVLAFYADLLVVVRTDGDINRVKAVFQLGERDVLADRNAGMYLLSLIHI